MTVIEDMYKLKGCKVRFSTETSSYEGVVKSILLQAKRIAFDKVTLMPKGKCFGLQNFFAHEIKSYSLISKPEEKKDNGKSKHRNLLEYSAGARGLNNHVIDDFVEDVNSECDDTIYEVCDEDVEEEFILTIAEEFQCEVPEDNVIIDSFKSDFYDAVKSMKRESSIGMSFEGKAIGRKGSLEWLCISTQCCTFLFDIQALGPKAFSEGLREIIENPAIEKIIHDCRQASDCLFHQFQTSLVNVFDTQVADLFVNMQLVIGSKKSMTKRVFTVDNCLARHLEMTSNFVQNQTFKKKYNESDSVMWASRPLSNLYRSRAINNVLYLKLLKSVLVKQMMNPFHRTVDLYLRVLKNASEQELELEPSVPQFVPEALVMEGIQGVCFNNFVEVSSTPSAGFTLDSEGSPVDRFLKSIENLSPSKEQSDTSNTIHYEKKDNVDKSQTKVETRYQKAKRIHLSKFQKNAHVLSNEEGKDLPCKKNNGHNRSVRGLVSPQGSADNYTNKLNDKALNSKSNDERNEHSPSSNISSLGSVSSHDGSGERIPITMNMIQEYFRRMSSDSGTTSSSHRGSVSSRGSCESDASTSEKDSSRKSDDRERGRKFSRSTASESDSDVPHKPSHIEWPVIEDSELPKNAILVPAGMILSNRRRYKS